MRLCQRLGRAIGGFFPGRPDGVFKLSATARAGMLFSPGNIKYFSKLRFIIHVKYEYLASTPWDFVGAKFRSKELPARNAMGLFRLSIF
jgi:hypothetical protein